MYKILIAESVEKYIDRLDIKERTRILKRLEMLSEKPKSVGEPRGRFWILKVGSGGYRISFRIIEEENVVRVTAIEQRKSERYTQFYH
ncbi:MAG: type II toxin-antitoxin system RelE/ParE family toxin [Candidatus Aenigmarchaeota archaeon]|nr:type II toxin-antitoxin system RelE/ParE family toxin [Candidatus Aenigmarchaeota archaeon]